MTKHHQLPRIQKETSTEPSPEDTTDSDADTEETQTEPPVEDTTNSAVEGEKV
jgi:hypothetical protein